MAGLGRRTHYRKHLTDAVLYELPEPDRTQRVGKIVGTRGSNQFDVLIAASSSSSSSAAEQDNNNTVLAILPTKFRKLVWLKRNDFVIAQTVVDEAEDSVVDDDGEDDDDIDDKRRNDKKSVTTTTTTKANREPNEGIRYMITHILYKDQIQHLVAKDLWPGHDPNFVSTDARAGPDKDNTAEEVQDDGIVYQEYGGYGENEEDGSDNDADLFVNTNRIANMAIEDSSSDEEDD